MPPRRFATLALAAGILASWPATAAEIPARFHGVWSTSTAKGQCRTAEWATRFDKPNESLRQIGRSKVEEWEGQCQVRTATPPSTERGTADGPATMSFACTSEGEEYAVRQLWDVRRIQGAEILVIATLDKPDIQALVRCR